jgi:serine/threonine-protein phosphatase 2A regulatory subunit A
MGGNQNSDTTPIDLLKEEMSSGEVFIKVNAIHRLKILATILGPEATRTSLVPYLTSKKLTQSALLNEEDEVLFALAEELGDLCSFISGSPSLLIAPLENLATMEEAVVRDQAVRSLAKITEKLTDSDIASVLAPVVLRMASSEAFYCRVSACGLFNAVYTRAGSSKEKLREKFLELTREDSPMVRRAAATFIGNLATVMERDLMISEFIPVFRQLSQDDMDQVRTLSLDSLITIAKILNKEENRLHTLPIIITEGEDKSWKVRYHFAIKFPSISEALGKEIIENSLVQTFVQLLRDIEPKVKSSALDSLSTILHTFARDKIQNLIFPAVSSIASDPAANESVRKNAADVVIQMSKSIGREFTLTRLIPIIQELISSDNQEVKLHLIPGLTTLASVVGVDILTPRILSSLHTLAKDSTNWRIREAVIITCCDLVPFVSFEIFERDLQDIFFLFLTDSVSNVRETGVAYIKKICENAREDWILSKLVSKLSDASSSQLGYLYRMTAIRSIAVSSIPIDRVFSLLKEAAQDPVPNVRLSVCKLIVDSPSRFDLTGVRQ